MFVLDRQFREAVVKLKTVIRRDNDILRIFVELIKRPINYHPCASRLELSPFYLSYFARANEKINRE